MYLTPAPALLTLPTYCNIDKSMLKSWKTFPLKMIRRNIDIEVLFIDFCNII